MKILLVASRGSNGFPVILHETENILANGFIRAGHTVFF